MMKGFRHHGRRFFLAGFIMATTLLLMMIMLTGPAWSFERSGQAEGSVATGEQDSCLSLLEAIGHASGAEREERSIRTDAGQALALGLVLGVRYAIGPKEQVGVAHGNKAVSDDLSGMSAISISAYRRCKNNQTIEAMNSF